MDRKELKRLAKEVKVEAGIYQIRNTGNGKVLVMATRNLRTVNGQRFALETGGHGNKELQQDWNTFGPAAFAVEVLEVLDKPETGYFDERGALKKLKQKWLEQLKPYGEQGYNRPTEEDEE
ncbi:MAG TPA: GIY-YIG nuclease family protein [Symbiobacteriaceae bacterium]|nr:GIY-YIG nuclease family protein [Symbiobacteriaceae bacterium]